MQFDRRVRLILVLKIEVKIKFTIVSGINVHIEECDKSFFSNKTSNINLLNVLSKLDRFFFLLLDESKNSVGGFTGHSGIR